MKARQYGPSIGYLWTIAFVIAHEYVKRAISLDLPVKSHIKEINTLKAYRKYVLLHEFSTQRRFKH